MSSEKTTKAYKVDPEVRGRVEELFKSSGVETEGDFLDHMASVYSMHLAKAGSGYEKHIAALEYHTKSIIEGVMSLLHTEAAERVKISDGYEEKLTERSASIFEYEQQISEISAELRKEATAGVEYRKQIEDFGKLVQQLQLGNERGEQLMTEYRSRIESLSEVIAANQRKIEAADNVREKLEQALKDARALEQERDAVRAELESLKTEHNKEIGEFNEWHLREMETSGMRWEIAQEKAVLAVQREAQVQLESERAAHTEQIRKLYEEMDRMRQTIAPQTERKPKATKQQQPGT